MLQSLSQKSSKDSQPGELSLVIAPTEVADVMVGKVATLSTHHGFDEAVRLMNDRHFRHCVVVDAHGKLVGVISDRDILRSLARHANSRAKSLDQIMTPNPIT
ncbi:MAG TPA: CBS domain-containing protein, partial [Candidatus Limnocylindrales bacterium]|nr:CBS domain-containing protein [Candidatus Limnocylindrales bacterium]